jgi:hypothetical protein
VPWATWQKWLKVNHEDAAAQYDFAYTSHLEVMADRTLQIYDPVGLLRARRKRPRGSAANQLDIVSRDDTVRGYEALGCSLTPH